MALALAGRSSRPTCPRAASGGCSPRRGLAACYVWAAAARPLRFRVVEEPGHGTVALAPGGRPARRRATYTPAAGFAGEDRFTYVATDARGLTSSPATARVTVAAPGGGAAGARGRDRAAGAADRGSGSSRRSGRWRVQLRASAPARLSGRLERRVRGRRTTYRLRSRRVGAGPARMALGRLARGRYRLRLYVDGKRGGRRRRFRVRRRRRF